MKNLTTIEKSKAVMPLITRICRDINFKWKKALSIKKIVEFKLKELTIIQRADMADELDIIVEQAKGYIDEVEDLGGVVHNFDPCIIHFPVLYRRQEICLCYILGKDNELNHYHLINQDCNNRQPIEIMDNINSSL